LAANNLLPQSEQIIARRRIKRVIITSIVDSLAAKLHDMQTYLLMNFVLGYHALRERFTESSICVLLQTKWFKMCFLNTNSGSSMFILTYCGKSWFIKFVGHCPRRWGAPDTHGVKGL